MRLCLKDYRRVPPPGNFQYTQPESGQTFTCSNWDGLKNKVFHHRKANDYPIGLLWEQEVEQYQAQWLEDHGFHDWVMNCDAPAVPHHPDQKLTLQDMIHGMKNAARAAGTIVATHLFSNLVEQGEANRRAAICASCEYNVPIEGCTGCGSARLRAFLEQTIGTRTTPHSDGLGACKQCGCVAKVKLWYPLDFIHKFEDDTVQKRLPAHCWVKKATA